MATLSPTFDAESARIRGEHRALISDLAKFDSALDRLQCYSEVFADLAAVDQICDYGHRLLDQLPEHFEREERTVLETVSRVSPQLAQFVEQIRREHGELRGRLTAFSAALEQVNSADDLYMVICEIKEQGKSLTNELLRHIATEERELKGFL